MAHCKTIVPSIVLDLWLIPHKSVLFDVMTKEEWEFMNEGID